MIVWEVIPAKIALFNKRSFLLVIGVYFYVRGTCSFEWSMYVIERCVCERVFLSGILSVVFLRGIFFVDEVRVFVGGVFLKVFLREVHGVALYTV